MKIQYFGAIAFLIATFLCPSFPSSFSIRFVAAQTEAIQTGADMGRQRLQRLAEDLKVRNAAERTKRNSLDQRIDHFVVSQAPVSHVVFCLNRLGVSVCHEQVAGPVDSYVDAEGVSAFAADHPISIKLKGVTVREILDEICEEDRRYVWEQDTKRGLFILKPRSGSRLEIVVGPVKESGNPYLVLAGISRREDVPVFALGSIRGGNNLPDITLDSSRCKAIELLDQIVAQHPGMTWRFEGTVTFNYPGSTWSNSVSLEYPHLKKGKHSNSDWRYKIVERNVNGMQTVTVERQSVKKPVDPGRELDPPAR